MKLRDILRAAAADERARLDKAAQAVSRPDPQSDDERDRARGIGTRVPGASRASQRTRTQRAEDRRSR